MRKKMTDRMHIHCNVVISRTRPANLNLEYSKYTRTNIRSIRPAANKGIIHIILSRFQKIMYTSKWRSDIWGPIHPLRDV